MLSSAQDGSDEYSLLEKNDVIGSSTFCISGSSFYHTNSESLQHTPDLCAPVEASPLPAAVRLRNCLYSSLQNRYFWANLVYLFYCTCMLCVDFVDYGKETNDKVYYFFGMVHFLNAWMYWYAWKDVRWRDPILYPEYLNVVGAALYLWSSSLYRRESGPHDAATSHIHVIETCAAIVELLACVGWAFTWHLTYERVPGRGYTLDDPDVWALLTIFAAAITYVVYNLQILAHPDWYSDNEVYFLGDISYAMNGVLYLLAGLRDDGWFWWMPLMGNFYTFAPSSSSPSSIGVEAQEEEVKSPLLAVVARREKVEKKERQNQIWNAWGMPRKKIQGFGMIEESGTRGAIA